MLKKMNLKETIAENYEDLIRLCISYSTDESKLKNLKMELQKRKEVLFNDQSIANAFREVIRKLLLIND